MIEVEHLTKRFGEVTAINDVTFSVEKGQILGFLGPNGAGKTTMMRILAGFFPASEGEARVGGFDVHTESLEVKKRVGYLPENPPLYTEMAVDDYLRFAARIKGVESAHVNNRLNYVKERCGLEDWGDRLIKHLSKGYRQRVGLAQALIHDPPILILDEPTVGLDPRQIIEVRELIKSLGGEHTVILSTHILPEVSMTCEKVTIIKAGRIAATDTPDNLTSQIKGGELIEMAVKGTEEAAAELEEALAALDSVERVKVSPGKRDFLNASVEVKGREDLRPHIARLVVESGLDLYELSRKQLTLEEIFLELTTEEAAVENVSADVDPDAAVVEEEPTPEVPEDEEAEKKEAADA